MQIICKNCGASVNASAKFCACCGCELRDKSEQPIPQTFQNVPPTVPPQYNTQQQQTAQQYGINGFNKCSIIDWKAQVPKAKKAMSAITGTKWMSFALMMISMLLFLALCIVMDVCTFAGVGSPSMIVGLAKACKYLYYPTLIICIIFSGYYACSYVVRELYVTFGFGKWIKTNNIDIFANSAIRDTAERIKNGSLKKRKNFNDELVAQFFNERPECVRTYTICNIISMVLKVLGQIFVSIACWYFMYELFPMFMAMAESTAVISHIMQLAVPFIVCAVIGGLARIADSLLMYAYGKTITKNTREWLMSREVR